MSDYKLRLIPVDVGINKVKIPVYHLIGRQAGKRIVITAGSDGDEYAGIEAAYQLINDLKSQHLEGEIIIIPILNIPGFKAKVSYNPLDGKYPKNVFPGKDKGSSTEKLICWLCRNYIHDCNFWIDLHGGSSEEYLTPFLYAFETKDKKLNNTLSQIITFSPLKKIVYAKSSVWFKVDYMAKKEIIYLLVEAGQKGERDEKWIKLHLNSVKSILSVLGIINYSVKKIAHQIFRKIAIINSNKDGLWYSKVKVSEKLARGSLIGEIRDIKNPQITKRIRLKQTGVCLWIKTGMFVQKNETLAGFGSKH